MFFCRQLQVLVSFVLVLSVVSSICLDEFKMCLLWLSKISLVLFMQLYLISIVLQFKIFLSLWSLEKCLSAIGADVFAEWVVVPEYVVPLSVFGF